MTPYLLYLRNAFTPNSKDHAIGIAIGVHRFTVNLGLCLGPLIGTVVYGLSDRRGVGRLLFVMSIITLTLFIVGVLMLKCLRWKRISIDSKTAPLLNDVANGEEHSVTISKIDLAQQSMSGHGSSKTFDQIQYCSILQDDKSCRFCTKISCFFSFGAIFDDKKHRHHGHGLSGGFAQRNSREKCRDSLHDSGYLNAKIAGHNGYNGHTTTNDAARRSTYGLMNNETVSVNTSSPLLAQSWNTLLRGAHNSLFTAPDNDGIDGADSLEHSYLSSAHKKPSKEKSKNLGLRVDRESFDNPNEHIDADEIEMSLSGDRTIDSEHTSTFQVNQPYHRPGPAISNRKNSESPSPFVRQAHLYQHQFVRRSGGMGMPGHGTSLRSNHISESMTTDKESQTFLLLSDDDFMSLREDTEDIYNAPEMHDESYGR